MPMALLLVGLIFLIAAFRGTEKELFALLKSDFTGKGNFIFWGLSLWLIGAVGYFPPLRRLSNAFLVLVVLALFLSNKGFFNKFMDAISGTQNAGAAMNSGGGLPFDINGGALGKKAGDIIGNLLKIN